jgi:hypothetical protein
MDSFFAINVNQDYTGVTFYFVGYPDVYAEGQADKFQSLIYAAPSKNVPGRDYRTRTTDHNAFNQFLKELNNQNYFFQKDIMNKGAVCPGLCDDTLKKWDTYSSSSYGDLSDLPGNDPKYRDAVLFSTRNTQLVDRIRHKTNHEGEFGGNETNSVYHKKHTIRNLARFIKDNSEANYPLIGMYFASYNSKAPVLTEGQIDFKQTTLIFVPLKYDLTSHTYSPDIEGYISFLKALEKEMDMKGKKDEKEKRKKDTENHGELCPKNCPEEDVF